MYHQECRVSGGSLLVIAEAPDACLPGRELTITVAFTPEGWRRFSDWVSLVEADGRVRWEVLETLNKRGR